MTNSPTFVFTHDLADKVLRSAQKAKTHGHKHVAFFDCDGTIIDGDVTEGSSAFPGLNELLITLLTSVKYSPCFTETEYQKFFDQYLAMYNINRNQGLSFDYVSQILSLTEFQPKISKKK